MKILFTGASSFTGLWFVETLAARGHTIVTPLQRSKAEYEGMRKTRVQKLKNCSKKIFECPFGSLLFLDLLEKEGPFDLICHHAANVTDYKSHTFDFVGALESNTLSINLFFEQLKAQKCQKLLLTGSLFEQREGLSSPGNQAVSPYGLSKGLTSDVFSYYSALHGIKLGKFVIPNPFGPYEEARFTTYLANSWLHNKQANVTFPEYLRDNIPVSLLAKSYAAFAESLTSEPGFSKLSPSFRPESQGAFVQSFSIEMQNRLKVPCEYTLQKQIDFSEPKVRINCDPVNPEALGWHEESAWDALAEFYLQTLSPK
jgi:nucleoside-diphosphate-sugar epimerase